MIYTHIITLIKKMKDVKYLIDNGVEKIPIENSMFSEAKELLLTY